MIGFFDYTVVLTYLSLMSAGAGVLISLNGKGHPYIGALCLLICGLCDAFDGRVARSKANRTQQEKKYGIQIDSLTDLVAFGVLPVCIGAALLSRSKFFHNWKFIEENPLNNFFALGVLFSILILYILFAMIRLAYFNVTEEERQASEGGARKQYVGLPVTSASLIFPALLMLDYLTRPDTVLIYFSGILITGIAFVSPFNVRKPGLKGILIMILFGALEFFLLIIIRIYK